MSETNNDALRKNGKRLREILSAFRRHHIIDTLAFMRNPENLRLAFEDLGPTFIKIGQILSVRTDILPEDFIEELKKLQDNTKSNPYSSVKKSIEESLGAPISSLFATFEQTPLASASMAQIHLATLMSGETVAVKVQHENIKPLMLQDMALMEKAIKLLNKLPIKKSFDPASIVKELADSVEKELNFLEEAQNIHHFYDCNHTVDYMHCLKCYDDYTTETVLVMEYIIGTKIADLISNKNATEQRHQVALHLVNNYMKQVFEDGFFHADPHPGNIIILEETTIAYIDFGMMGVLNKKLVEQFNQFLYAIYLKDIDKLTEAILAICTHDGSVDEGALYRDINTLFTNYIDLPIEEMDMAQIFRQVFSVCNKHNLQIPNNITLLLKSIVTIEGIINDLDNNLTIMTAVGPYMKRYLSKNFDLVDELKTYGSSILQMTKDVPKLPTKLLSLIDGIKKGRVKLQLEHNGLNDIVKELDTIANKLVIALIASALIIGSSLLVQTESLRVVGIVGYVIAAVMGILLIISILYNKRKKK